MKKENKYRKRRLLLCFWFLFLLENTAFFGLYNTFWVWDEFIALLKERSCEICLVYVRVFYYFGVYVIFLFAIFVTQRYYCDRLSSKAFDGIGLVIIVVFAFLLGLMCYCSLLPLVSSHYY
ncbi:hypothetical protein [Candidatus Uabimicrobium sp. HlEnr_7]|uniref:hypothetical protein n=1 Tax=Candidatus Uabimicrobium helgolandensis TaxID=3095367 RepID=UPI00355683D7